MKTIILSSILALLLSSCATMMTGSFQSITIESEPSGANVIIRGKKVGTTPVNLILKRNTPDFIHGAKVIRLEKEGYQSKDYLLFTTIEPVTILNFVFMPFWLIDIATGSVSKFRYDNYNFKLNPLENENQQIDPFSEKYKQIEQLKKLLDNNAITKEEYEKEKTKILDN